MAIQVDPPVRTPYRYGLLTVAQIVEHATSLRLNSPYEFDSVACHDGQIWNTLCADAFTVTFTRTAVANTFSVTVTPGAVGSYQYNVNGGSFTTLTATVVIAAAPPVTVVVRESSGLQRSVTLTNVNPTSPAGTAFVFHSTQTNNAPKTPTEGVSSRQADPFLVIAPFSCTLVATPDIEQKARDVLASREQMLVEEQYWAQLASSSPTILAGGAAVPLAAAVAQLESYLRTASGYTGVIHSSSYAAPFVSKNDLITELNPETTKRTMLWTPWVFGGGYARTGPAGQAAPASDQAWLYATGQVVIHRGNINVYGGPSGGFNTATNQDLVVAERSYVVLNDCPIAAVLADLDA